MRKPDGDRLLGHLLEHHDVKKEEITVTLKSQQCVNTCLAIKLRGRLSIIEYN